MKRKRSAERQHKCRYNEPTGVVKRSERRGMVLVEYRCSCGGTTWKEESEWP